MTWARAEIQALLLRAARGAGVPLSHAEDLAIAIADFGTNATLEAAANALAEGWCDVDFSENDGTIIFANARALVCLPVALDALSGGARRVELQSLDEPTLIEPYLAAARARVSVAATAQGEIWVLDHAEQALRKPLMDRFDPSQKVLETLGELAARTYVPASGASRDGAGAGAIDND